MNSHTSFKVVMALCLWVLMAVSVQAQKEYITVRGQLTDGSGQPIPGASVVIEGTTNGTITDINGLYKISAPLGATLELSFIGMKTQRAIVTRTGLNPVGTRQIIPYISAGQHQTGEERAQHARVDSINYAKRMERYLDALQAGEVPEELQVATAQAREIRTCKDRWQTYRFIEKEGRQFYTLGNVELETGVSVLWADRLPGHQSVYAQGRPLDGALRYRGPETGELFSRGPPIQNLEFDGVPTSYDNNGSLVHRGTGNGQRARYYNPDDLVNTGVATNLHLKIYQRFGDAKVALSLGDERTKGVLPLQTSGANAIGLSVMMDHWLTARVNYSKRRADNENGWYQSRLMAASYLTPGTFDNANGMSRKEAQTNPLSSTLPDGSVRSAAAKTLDNPFYLLQNATDQSGSDMFTYGLSLKHSQGSATTSFSMGGEWLRQSRLLDMPSGMVGMGSGRSSDRDEDLNHHFAELSYTNTFFHQTTKVHMPVRAEVLNYDLSNRFHTGERINLKRERTLLTANPALSYSGGDDLWYVKAGASVYASSTGKQTFVRPAFGAYIHPFRVLDELFYWYTEGVFTTFKVHYDYVTQFNEYSLNNAAGLNNSLFVNTNDYFTFFETHEVNVGSNVVPEASTTHNLSVEMSFLYGRLTSETSFFRTEKTNSFFPVASPTGLYYENVADITTRGWEQSIGSNLHLGSLFWQNNLVVSAIRPVVTRLYQEAPVALAGFADMHSALVEGRPVGVLRGTSYAYNEAGQRLIGADGFPLVSEELTVIGNPNPDCILGFSSRLSLKGWQLGFTVEATLGGDVYNGTGAFMDYHGVSDATAGQRTVRDYIFDGVTVDGNVNNQAVDFAPNDGDVYANRWVRYGPGGVASEYITDGSRVVLKDLHCAYRFHQNVAHSIGLNQLMITLNASNLVTLSGYKGNLASNTLWGQSNTNGLDVFNNPFVRRIGLSLKATF